MKEASAFLAEQKVFNPVDLILLFCLLRAKQDFDQSPKLNLIVCFMN